MRSSRIVRGKLMKYSGKLHDTQFIYACAYIFCVGCYAKTASFSILHSGNHTSVDDTSRAQRQKLRYGSLEKRFITIYTL